MLLLGDQPFIDPHVVDALIDDYRSGRRGITIPVCNGRRGHPVIFDARYRAELLSVGDRGARAVVANHAADIFEVPVESSNVLKDMDTPQEYREAKAQMEEEQGEGVDRI
jgi:molybdenum cofactor cytidylyltransferase